MKSDFASGNLERETWSALYSRFLSAHNLVVAELPKIAGIGQRTYTRRVSSGIELLVSRLRELEVEAVHSAGTEDALSPLSRIVVRGSNDATIEVSDPAALLLESVRSNDRIVRLSRADCESIARQPAQDLESYLLSRIAKWSRPSYRLDERFVDLTLLIDQGEDESSERWIAEQERYASLPDILNHRMEPVLVLLGPPGSGKSTLLRHLELQLAISSLRGETQAVPYYVQLNHFAAERHGELPPTPREWLERRWSANHRGLEDLSTLLAQGRVVFLLDALNEIPASSRSSLAERIHEWKRFAHETVAGRPGNRVVFSCRSLDYSHPLSTPGLRVPQIQIGEMTDEQVQRFLRRYAPQRATALWRTLRESPELEIVRWPFFLLLLLNEKSVSTDFPRGRAALFTGFVREALRREVERDNALFTTYELLTERDVHRIVHARRWRTMWELPEKGKLIPEISRLAFAMQESRTDGEQSQVRVPYDTALEILGKERGQHLIRAGVALAVLDEDSEEDEVAFVHQLIQEYFAARVLTKRVDLDLVYSEWRTNQREPQIDDLIDSLDPGRHAPIAAVERMEETFVLALEMAENPDGLVREVMEANLSLAGRSAAQAHVRARLSNEVLEELRAALVRRSRNSEADMRERIVCATALDRLGDPRFEQQAGPYGAFFLPPMTEIRGGRYPIGSDTPIDWGFLEDRVMAAASGKFEAHMPVHEVELRSFQIGRFPVSNREWARFLDGGGYHDERWWDIEDGRRWLRGELSQEGWNVEYQANLAFRQRLLEHPGLLEQMAEDDLLPRRSSLERWQKWLELSEVEFESAVEGYVEESRFRHEPKGWDDDRFNSPSQPVVGINWYEARAYCEWLSAQTGLPFRLPSEVEYEAAAGGSMGRLYPWGSMGDDMSPSLTNTFETQLKRPSPIGVFPSADSPQCVTDLAGNVKSWTSSLFGDPNGTDPGDRAFSYPYRADDGRENPKAHETAARVLKGGAWRMIRSTARVQHREGLVPMACLPSLGLRLVCAPPFEDVASE